MQKKASVIRRDSKDKSPNGYLATLFRRIVRNSVGVTGLPSLVMKSLILKGGDKESLKVSKSTLNEMYADKMTFNTFLKIVNQLFRPKKLMVKVVMELDDGTIITDTITPIDRKLQKDRKDEDDNAT